MIQIRNVPARIHRTLKARAALAGMSLSDFLLREIERVASRPSQEELLARLAKRPRSHRGPPVEEIVREARQTGGRRSHH